MPDTVDQAHNAFYGPHESLDSMLEAAGRLCTHASPVRGTCLATNTAFEQLVQRLQGGRAQHRGFVIAGTDPCLVQLPVPDRESPNGESTAKAFLWKSVNSSAVYILTCQPRGIFQSLRDAVCDYLRPDATRAYLRTRQVRDALRALARRQSGISIRVKAYVAKSLIDDPDTGKRVKRTEQEWTDEDHALVFQRLQEEGKWLSSMLLEVNNGLSATGRVGRDMDFSCSSGLPVFYRSVLGELERAALQSRRFYEERDRMSSPTGQPRPLRVRYGRDVFTDKRQNHRLVEVLSRLPNSAVSVMHPNPYLHASMVDYSDGSSCEIWVTTPNEVLVVPRRRARPEALGRLCDFICDEFEEGDVLEASGT